MLTASSELIAELLVAVQLLTGYAAPSRQPVIEFVPQTGLQQMACDGPCDVRGWYGGGSTIYLDDRLDPEMDIWHRGILVHELVHFLQEQVGAFGVVPSCRRWLDRESEAYNVQRRWLWANRKGRLAHSTARFPRFSMDCEG